MQLKLQHKCFLAKFDKCSWTASFTQHLWWLLLKVWEMSLLNKFFPATEIIFLFIYFKILQNSQENAYAGVSFLNKIADWRTSTLLSRNSSTGISCEFCEIFNKNTFTEKTRQLLQEMTWKNLWHFGEILCKMYLI